MRRCTVLLLCLALAVGASAQQRTYVIAVAIDSRDGRIQQWLPELRNAAADTIQRAARNARAVIVTGEPAEAAERARRNAADYLLEIEISPRSAVSVGAGAPPSTYPDIVGTPRANAQGAIFLAWTLEPMNGKRLRLHDSRYVQPSEYPLGPKFDWLYGIASRSVRDAAAAAVGKLKAKKGLQP